MPEYLSPGVYVEEVDRGPRPIEGVSTSTAGFVGVTERGRVGWPTLVTSRPDFARKFGNLLPRTGYPDAWYLPTAVGGFFDEGGARVYVTRVLPETASTASLRLFDRGETTHTGGSALASTAAVGDGTVLLEDASTFVDGDALVIVDGAATEYAFVGSQRLVVLHEPLAEDWAAGTEVEQYAVETPDVALSSDVEAGATLLELASDPGVATGDQLLVHDAVSGRSEVVTVGTMSLGTAVRVGLVGRGLAFGHSMTGATVRRVEPSHETPPATARIVHPAPQGSHLLVLDAPLSPDASHVLGPATGSSEVPGWVYSFSTGPHVQALATPLSRRHLPGEAGGYIESIGLDDSSSLSPIDLVADVRAGDTDLTINPRDDVVPGQILRAGASDTYLLVDVSYVPATGEGTVRLAGAAPRSLGATASGGPQLVIQDQRDRGDALLVRPAGRGQKSVVLAHPPDGSTADRRALRLGDEVHEFGATTSRAGLVTLESPLRYAHTFDPVTPLPVRGRQTVLQAQATDPGAWGNRVRVTVTESDPIVDTPVAVASAGDMTVELRSANGVEAGTVLEFYTAGADGFEFRQKAAGRVGNLVSLPASGLAQRRDPGTGQIENVPAAGLAEPLGPGMRVRTREFQLTVELLQVSPSTGREDLVAREDFRNLSMDPRHSRYVVRLVGQIPTDPSTRSPGQSQLIRLADPWTELTWPGPTAQEQVRLGPDAHTYETQGLQRRVGFPLRGGDDDLGSLTDSDYVGHDAVDPDDRTGLQALRNIEQVSIVAIPGRTSQRLQQALINHCESMRYRFAILDPPLASSMQQIQEHRDLYDSRYAALYYPWLLLADPFPASPSRRDTLLVPPSGHVAGVFARTDISRGVHKAPANELVRSCLGLEFSLTKGEQDILNPRAINAIRDFRSHQRGVRVYGSRCATTDLEWMYVSVRRLFLFLEHSIDRGTQWVVFEPNDHRTWARVRQSVSNFLTMVWRSGALFGQTPEQAFFVKCDEETNPWEERELGRLTMLVGVAPVKPAEFVIIRIGQWSSGSVVEEFQRL